MVFKPVRWPSARSCQFSGQKVTGTTLRFEGYTAIGIGVPGYILNKATQKSPIHVVFILLIDLPFVGVGWYVQVSETIYNLTLQYKIYGLGGDIE